ncbi:hypothetical protein [Piscirickettsia litoralis]|uniref:Uncharacterized protein n=1 Tax=Piscirickettsia litoralis TaxID=1891921 RepID=A0ABX2ZYF5_9GAMM|nr:hypothetical protein [Piscirickettsia litoralis]ODN41637.1 hypothetical protein BGC07_16215 [Piscirickettsia litoralis]
MLLQIKITVDKLKKDSVNDLLESKAKHSDMKSIVDVANNINALTNEGGVSGGASSAKLKFGLTLESVMRDLIRSKDGNF